VREYNDPAVGRRLLARIEEYARTVESVTIMEVCGTHTMAVGRFGIRRVLPENVRLVSGPGCPVCVTPGAYIDNAARLARSPGITVATFGDMVRVPGIRASLEEARARGGRVIVVTSPLEVLRMKGEVVFCAVGFETTIAPIAGALKRVVEEKREEVSFYTACKVIPPTLHLLAGGGGIRIDGFLLPGHVSAVIGSDAYGRLPVPACISGFDMVDILYGVMRILAMITEGEVRVENGYPRVVTREGNRRAKALIERFFAPADEPWRGIGVLPGCSLAIREEYAAFDARRKYDIPPEDDAGMPAGCACGEVLTGVKTPSECALFAGACTPEHPVGPCMVSSEGSCAAFFKYERECP